jgi:hypothetical protein
MGTAQKLFEEFGAENSPKAGRISVFYHCYDLPHDNPLAALEAAGFPRLYSRLSETGYGGPNEGDWGNALCVRQRVVGRIDQTSVYAVAVFELSRSFQFGPEPKTAWEDKPGEIIKVPLVRLVDGPGTT